MPDKSPNQYLKNLDVQFISLVDAGANLKELVYKSAETSREAGPVDPGSASSFSKQVDIAKTDEEKRLVYCIVYSPDEIDAEGDAMKAEEIEKAAHHFLFEGRTDKVDKQHDEDPDEGRIVESYIIGKSDANFPDDPEGSWAVVIKVLDDDTWDEVKKGSITGVSMQGRCNVEAAEKSEKSLLQKIKALFESEESEKREVRSKDFTDRLMGRQIAQAMYAFEEEVHSISRDEEVEDKKAAVLGVIDDFKTYVSSLEKGTTKQKTTPDMSKETTSKAEEPEKETNGGEEPSDIEKAIESGLQKHLNPVNEKLDSMEERLKAVEKAAPGSQVVKGQDEKETTEKGYKGVSLFGSGPQE